MKPITPFRAIFIILVTAIITATVLIFFSPGQDIDLYLNNQFSKPRTDQKEPSELPTLLPNDQSRIGIVAGHWGFDTGHVCGNELNNVQEVDVNLRVATMVRNILVKAGYTVDLLHEFDPSLSDYTGLALLAIHNDTCDFINESASGFKVSSTAHVSYPAEAKKFNDCLVDRYQRNTDLPFRGSTISSDSDMFYAYNMINNYMTASVIETGYLNLDYRFLTEKTEKVAQGLAEGILCYINNETISNDEISKPVDYSTAFSEVEKRFILPGIDNLQ